MLAKKNRARPILAVTALAFFVLPALAAALTAPATAAPSPTAATPDFAQGSTSYLTAPAIQFNTTGAFWGVLNTTSGGIEQIRGHLDKSTTVWSHFYRIDLDRGKVLDARLHTLNAVYVPFAGSSRVSPDFEIYTYAGIPSIDTMIDWNAGPGGGSGWSGGNFNNEIWQENNILAPISPRATYYINVTVWYGVGDYDLIIDVFDPTPLIGGDYTGTLNPESAISFQSNTGGSADTRWYRYTAAHDTALQVFEEASGYLRIDNWNSVNPFQIDAIIRVFAEDVGYSPDNPIGKPIEKSEAPNRQTEPFSVLAPYTGTYYVMLRISNVTSATYTLHFNLTQIPRFPQGGILNVHKERDLDDTDWYWFNMSKGVGTGLNDRVIFNMSETSDDPLKPVNMNLWLFGYRGPYFKANGNTLDFDILNSSFQQDAPYNNTINPDPRYEEVAAQAAYTGVYFLEVEDFNNTGNYSVSRVDDTSPNRAASDYNNEPSNAQVVDWGVYNWTINQSEDHSDFYKLSAKAGETIEVTYEMPRRSSPDGSITNATLGLIWLGIYQPGMTLLNWSWNYHYDIVMNTPVDYLENFTTVRATVAADGDYIIEVTAMQDGYIGPFQRPGTPPPPILQVFWHMDWNMATRYTLWVSRLPLYNALFEAPFVKQALPDISFNEDEPLTGVYNLSDYFDDPDKLQGDRLSYTFTFSGQRNLTITEVNGLVTIVPEANWSGINIVQVRATDLQRNYIQQSWNITVLPVNDPPYLATDVSIKFKEDSGVTTLALANYIRDVDGDALQFAQVADPNITLQFTNVSIRVTTAPDFESTTLGIGDYPIDVDVNDGTTIVRLRLHFNVENVLDAPRVLRAAPNMSCDEDVACPTLDLNTIFYDPDDPTHEKPLNFLVSGNGDVQYDLSLGILQLRPPQDWSGARTIQLQAIKFSTPPPPAAPIPYPSDIVELNLIVREINDPPRIQSYTPVVPTVTLREDQFKVFVIDAVDPEHLQPKYRWYIDDVMQDTTLPSFTFQGNYDMAQQRSEKNYTLKAVADDGSGGLAEHAWNVSVGDVPRRPEVSIASPLEGPHGYYTGEKVQFYASAFDPDGDSMLYIWTDSAGFPILTGASGNVTFDSVGTRKLTLTVFDGVAYENRTVNVTIESPPATKGFLPGFEGPSVLGAMAAVAAVGIVASRRRRGA